MPIESRYGCRRRECASRKWEIRACRMSAKAKVGSRVDGTV